MRFGPLLARSLALSVPAGAVLLSIASSPSPPFPVPALSVDEEGPTVTLSEPHEERRFEIEIEVTPEGFERPVANSEVSVMGRVLDPPEGLFPDLGGDDADPQLSEEEAAEHPTAFSVVLREHAEAADEEDAAGEEDPAGEEGEVAEDSAHLALVAQETPFDVVLPLSFQCDDDGCAPERFLLTMRGPRESDETGPIEVRWTVSPSLAYFVDDSLSVEENNTPPAGAALTVTIRPLEDEAATPE